MVENSALGKADAVNPFDPNTWTEEERFYFEYVDKKLKAKENVGISNGKPIHAVYLIERFLRQATQQVRLFSGKLSRAAESGTQIYADPHVAAAALKFLSKEDSRLTVVLEKDIDVAPRQSVKDHPLVNEILTAKERNEVAGTFELCKIDNDQLDFLNKQKANSHFMVLDKRAYRIETDPNPEKLTAYVNFGDTKSAGILADLFDKCINFRSENLIPSD